MLNKEVGVRHTEQQFILPLDQAQQYSAISGGKATNLGTLLQAGFAVPPGFVISTHAFILHTTAANITQLLTRNTINDTASLQEMNVLASSLQDALLQTPLCPEVEQELLQAYEALVAQGYQHVAVRSSATVEDLPTTSFAGQFETILDVEDGSALLQAVKRCWSSLFSPQAIRYHYENQLVIGQHPMAVVVQAMVFPDVAGVLFTRHPVSNEPHSMLVSASYGLGEVVVSGRVMPDSYTLLWQQQGPIVAERQLGGKELCLQSGPAGLVEQAVSEEDRRRFCMESAELLELAGIGKQLEQFFGSPQDVEWAVVKKKLFVLQTRPITTATTLPKTRPARGFLARLHREALTDYRDHFPLPLRPLDLDTVVFSALAAVFAAVRWFGLFLPPVKQVIRFPADGTYNVQIPAPRLSPHLIMTPVRLVSLIGRNAQHDWRTIEEPLIVKQLAQLAPLPEEASAQELVQRFTLLNQLLCDFCTRRYRKYVLSNQILHDMLLQILTLLTGDDAWQLLKELTSVPQTATATMNAEINALAQEADASLLKRFREVPADQRWQQLLRWPEAAPLVNRVQAFLDQYGQRPVQGMVPVLSYPVWREEPEAVLALMLAISGIGFAADKEQNALTESAQVGIIRRKLCQSVPGRLGLSRVALFLAGRARAAFWAREGSLVFVEQIVYAMRLTTLLLGQLLVRQGALTQPEEVFLLRVQELAALVQLPAFDTDHLRTFQRLLHDRQKAWEREQEGIAQGEIDSRDHYSGLPASAGKITARVRVIASPESFEELQQGEVLVCPFTTPTWTPLFSLAAAVITETGGPLSHAAIIAREYRIPAIMSVSGATRLLATGSLVIVDGTQGTVTPVKQDA